MYVNDLKLPTRDPGPVSIILFFKFSLYNVLQRGLDVFPLIENFKEFFRDRHVYAEFFRKIVSGINGVIPFDNIFLTVDNIPGFFAFRKLDAEQPVSAQISV